MSSSSDGRRPTVLRGDRAGRAVTVGGLDDLREHANRQRVNPAYLAEVTAEGYRAGEQQGYAAGHAAGYVDGTAAARTEIDAMAAQTRRLMASVEHVVAELRAADRLRIEAVQLLIADAALELARVVVGREFATGPAEVLARALDLVGDEPAAVVRLHPDDALAVADLELPPEPAIRIVADPAVDRAGCVVDLGDRHLDARIGPALDRARAVLEDDA